jgi:asparagine synthase (glutamine-hydrolysing)
MCGIAGILGRVGERNHAALRRMSDAMVHRGPDADGTWSSPPDARGHGVMLAHRRLAIIDLSPAGVQPMHDPVTGHVTVYNGEIYNYQAVRAELALAGHRFASTGDTAVMLRAISTQGRGAVKKLRGMYAMALWDPEKRELLLVRDPLGIKPLYVATNPDPDGDWSVAFASEVRALLASGLLGAARLDPQAAASVVWNGFVVGPQTVVAGVASLSPGELRVYDAAGRQTVSEEHWAMPPAGHGPPATEAEVSDALEECLRLHLISDVPLGIFLSSGIDSSAVANLAQRAAKAGKGTVRTFTLAFEEKEFDEGAWARKIARAIGTEHQEVVLSEQRFVSGLEAALDSLDQPTFDGLNSYFMSVAVREAGFTVALVGTGGDELFGGYTSFRDLPALLAWSRRARRIPRSLLVALAKGAVATLQRSHGAFPRQTRWAKLPDMVENGDDLLALYQLAYALFLPSSQRELVGAEAARKLVDGLPPRMRDKVARETRGRSPLAALSIMEQRLFLGERLLRDNDAASMAASIEQRLPLVDQVLFETVDRLPEALRYEPVRKKAALRRMGLRGLDPALFDRPKVGFVLPFDRWIRQGLTKAVDETLRDATAVRAAGLRPEPVERLWRAFKDGAPGVYWSRVWSLYCHVRWCHRHKVFA